MLILILIGFTLYFRPLSLVLIPFLSVLFGIFFEVEFYHSLLANGTEDIGFSVSVIMLILLLTSMFHNVIVLIKREQIGYILSPFLTGFIVIGMFYFLKFIEINEVWFLNIRFIAAVLVLSFFMCGFIRIIIYYRRVFYTLIPMVMSVVILFELHLQIMPHSQKIYHIGLTTDFHGIEVAYAITFLCVVAFFPLVIILAINYMRFKYFYIPKWFVNIEENER
jgi:hypothetical protein